MEYKESLIKNEYKVNKMIGYIALGAFVGFLVMFLLNYMEVFKLNKDEVSIVFGVLSVGVLTIFLLTVVLNVQSPSVKYVSIALTNVLVMIGFAFLSMHMVLVLMLPILASCLYFNRRMNLVTSIETVMAMFVGHVLSVPLSIVYDDPLIVSYKSALLYGFLPRLIEYLILTGVIMLLTHITSNMMTDIFQYVTFNHKLVEELKSTQIEVVQSLAQIAENKSEETGEHLERVSAYMYVLAKGFGLPENEAYNVSVAAMLHDIGKLGVDEKILSKPGKLTPEEFEEVKKHVIYGKELLQNSPSEIMQIARVIAEQHHEHWDGNGYLGLKKEQIHLYSRMMAVVDVFDALTSRRSYKDSWSVDAALREIIRCSGEQFDPEVVFVFKENFDKIYELYVSFQKRAAQTDETQNKIETAKQAIEASKNDA